MQISFAAPLRSVLAAACVGLVLAASAAGADEAKLSMSNKWRISISGGAESDGTMQFRVTPKDGTAVEVGAAIKKGRGENEVAKDLRDAMRKGLDQKPYHIETDDGEDVLVKKRGSAKDFALELVSSDVKGVRVSVKKE